MSNFSDIKRVEKGWGHELWIANSAKYCGKLLYFNADTRCSFHYHKLKDETFYLQSGSVMVALSGYDLIEQATWRVMSPGDSLHIPIGIRHQIVALDDSELFEFSTEHFDSDSYRIVKGD